MEDFLNIVDWLYQKSAQFGVKHILIGKKVYWLDNDQDRKELLALYKNSTQK